MAIINKKPKGKRNEPEKEELIKQLKLDDLNARERQIVLSDGQLKKTLLEKILLGTPVYQACQELSVPMSTFRMWCMKDEGFTQAYKSVRVGEKLMLVMKARETLSELLDDKSMDFNGKPIVAASTKLATAKFILEHNDGDFKENTAEPIQTSTDNPEDAFIIVETVSESKPWHDGTGAGNMVIVVESDGDDVRSGVRGKSDESDFLEDD